VLAWSSLTTWYFLFLMIYFCMFKLPFSFLKRRHLILTSFVAFYSSCFVLFDTFIHMIILEFFPPITQLISLTLFISQIPRHTMDCASSPMASSSTCSCKDHCLEGFWSSKFVRSWWYVSTFKIWLSGLSPFTTITNGKWIYQVVEEIIFFTSCKQSNEISICKLF
jgi:hypothetical protein